MEEQECFVSGALATVLRFARFGGTAPLKFQKKGSGWRVRLSTGFNIYGYFLVTVIIVATISTLICDLQLPKEETIRMSTRTNRVVWIFEASCMMLIAATCAFGAPAQMRSMIVALNKVEKINMDLNTQHWPMHYERKKICLFFFWVLFTIALTTIDHVFMMSAPEMSSPQTFVSVMYSWFYCCYWIMQLREMTFIMITLHTMYCFRAINKKLKNLLRELTDGNELPVMTLFNSSFCKPPKKISFKNTVNRVIADTGKVPLSIGVLNSTNQCELVRQLAVAYAKTCDVVQEIDAAHGLILLMMLGSFLMHLVGNLYYFINYIIIRDSPSSHPVEKGLCVYCFTIQLLWCIYHTGHMLMIVEPCHLTHIEMETTRQLVSHLMRCPASIYDPLAIELDLFCKHLFLNQTAYSALQATKISRSLVATILGSITTYLVLVVPM